MLEISLIRNSPDIVRSNLKQRNDPQALKRFEQVIEKDKKWRHLGSEVNELRSQRNTISKQINEARKQGKDISSLLKLAKDLPKKIKTKDEQLNQLREELDQALMRIPNLLHESVPDGKSEEDNVEVRCWGKQKDKTKKPTIG